MDVRMARKRCAELSRDLWDVKADAPSFVGVMRLLCERNIFVVAYDAPGLEARVLDTIRVRVEVRYC